MMLGLESWMPLYMTGQVSPYYLRGKHNGVYCHFNYVAGKAALSGECIHGHHDSGRYCLTKNREEVAYFSKKVKHLLAKARPLMEVYRSESEKQYSIFVNTDASAPGPRHNILSSLPLYTMDDELLERLLDSNDVPADDRAVICAFAQKQKEFMENILRENTVTDDVPLLTEEEFAEHPMVMSISDIFYEKELHYSYEEYRMHLKACRDFAEKHKSYRFNEHEDHAFRNIQIRIHEGRWAIISKNKAPAMHFVIRRIGRRSSCRDSTGPNRINDLKKILKIPQCYDRLSSACPAGSVFSVLMALFDRSITVRKCFSNASRQAFRRRLSCKAQASCSAAC